MDTVYAALGGFLPALAWLWFWLREDSKHPEPRRLIALAFFAGMLSVVLVIPLQKAVGPLIAHQSLTLIAWAAIEEVMKYFAALATVLWRHDDDEPIDAVIYMIVVALGFAALENTLFLLSPISGSTIGEAIVVGNFRFIGATLLHILSSAAIGVALALFFYRSWRIKIVASLGGVILAVVLHSLFNLLILGVAEEHIIRTFSFVWVGIVGLLAVLEYIKRIHPRITRT
jgi:protease PrsW